MTLVVTLIGHSAVAQSADYRLTDTRTGLWADEAQKQLIVSRTGWTALVSFAGVGAIGPLRTSDWLIREAENLSLDATYQELLVSLVRFDQCLRKVDPALRRHTFVVAGFVGTHPTVSLVSNFERFSTRPGKRVASRMSSETRRVGSTALLLNGSGAINLLESERNRIVGLLAKKAEREIIQEALAGLSSTVAARNSTVSVSCSVGFLTPDGKGASRAFDANVTSSTVSLAPNRLLSPAAQKIQELLQDHFPAGYGMVEQHFVQAPPATKQAYMNLLKRFPESAEIERNYAGLLQTMGEVEEAHRRYESAVSKDPNDVTTLAIRGEFLWRQLQLVDDAEHSFKAALAIRAPDALVSTLYADFLRHVREDYPGALKFYLRAIDLNRRVPQRAASLALFHMNELADLDEAEKWISAAFSWGPPFDAAELAQAELKRKRR